MPFEAKNYGPFDRIYSFVGDDGTSVNVDSQKLRAWCMVELRRGNLTPGLCPVNASLAQKWIKDGTCNFEHVFDLLEYKTLDPIIFGKWEGKGADTILIDGHHRYCLMGLMQEPYIPGFVLEACLWRQFEIIGLPGLSAAELDAYPAAPNTWRPK